MLTSLIIDATIKEGNKKPRKLTWQYSALQMLVFLQQALPGVLDKELDDHYEAVSIGLGTKGSPYRPSCAPHWFYVAKMKGTYRYPNLTNGFAWIKVGGRMISIDPTSLYSSDRGTDGQSNDNPNPTYPNLRDWITQWKNLNRVTNTDRALCDMFYKVARGQPVFNMPQFLPVLINVLLVSEVARNHTAFHTNLMATDLIRAGVAMPTTSSPISWTWENAIWMTDACPACDATGGVECQTCAGEGKLYCNKCNGKGLYKEGIKCNKCTGPSKKWNTSACNPCNKTGWFKAPLTCNQCGGTGIYANTCNTCAGYGSLECGRCNGKRYGTVWDEFDPLGHSDTTVFGGGENLQNGLLPMSHMGSAFGSAFRLSNDKDKGNKEQFYLTLKGFEDKISKAPSPLTVVRRKEASILIQWLALVLAQVPDLDFEKIEVSKKESNESEEVVTKTDIKITIATRIGMSNINTSSINFATVFDEVLSLATSSNFGERSNVDPLDTQVKAAVRTRILEIIQMRVDMISNLLS